MSNKYKHGKYRISIADDKNIQNKVVSITDDEGNDALSGGSIDISGKADKVSNATNGNLAGLDSNGNITDSGNKASDFATASQGAKADTAYQKPQAGIPESDLSSDVQQALQKHFKGWYASSSALPANPVIGDYAYVKGATSTDPAAIYECTTSGSWSDSGRTADTSNVQTFATGEKVNETPIDDTHLANPKDGALPTAADVMQLKAKLEVVTASETKASYVAVDGYKVQGTGTLSSNANAKYTTIPLNGAKGVRFLGVNLLSSSTAATKNTGYCFGHYNGEEIEENWVIDTYYTYEATADNTSVEEYIAIPTPISTHLRTNVKYSVVNEDNFYCYLQIGDSVLDVINDAINDAIEELKDDDDITRSNLNWQLHPLGLTNYLYPKEKNNTFTTISVNYPIYFKKVAKDELVKIECVRECKMYLSDSLPADGVVFTYIIIPEGVTIYRCASDGYISFSSYYFSSETYSSSVYLYTMAPNIDAYIKHKLKLTLTPRSAIDTCINSDTFAAVAYVNSNNYGLSNAIDVSGYSYVGVVVYYTASNFGYSGRGCMFFNENYVPGENDAQCVVGEPIGTVKVVTGKSRTSFFKVPDGAKYFRVFGYISSLVVYGLDNNETTIDPDEITEIVEGAVENIAKQEAATISPKTIFELNHDTEMLAKMVIAKKKFNSGASNPGTITPLVLAHISDAHGAATQYQRYIEFANHWKLNGYIDELIDTGDVGASVYNDGLAWRNAIEGVGDILTVTGNHDTRCDAAEQEAASLTLYDIWQYHGAVSVDPSKRTDAYNLLLAGKVNNWGVTQPSNAAANGLCYYYKDYASQGIRLIALDVMGYDQDQQDWLEARLAEALTLTYHVVIIAHFTATPMTPLICNYTSLRLTGSTFHPYMSRYLEETNTGAIAEAVDTYQTNGGNFIGYIIGHYHRDMINVVTGYPKQLVFAVDSGGVTTTRDFTKVVGCKSYDDFQVISINTEDKTVKLIKVGADTDYYMRKKSTVSVGYTLVKDDGTEPSSGESATKVKGIIGEGF